MKKWAPAGACAAVILLIVALSAVFIVRGDEGEDGDEAEATPTTEQDDGQGHDDGEHADDEGNAGEDQDEAAQAEEDEDDSGPSTTEAPEEPAPTTAPATTVAPAAAPAPAAAVPAGATFSLVDGVMKESFDGAPAAPTAWGSDSWDISVHSRDDDTFEELDTMEAMHGPDCAGPPALHETSAYEDAVFQCKDHMMTAIKASGYGAIYLTPAAEIDFSSGEAVIRVDVSTLITSDRDYWDVWITPFEDNVQMPSGILNGMPRNGLRLLLNTTDESFEAEVFVDGDVEELDQATDEGYSDVLEPDPARRDTFEIRVSQDHVTVGMPNYGLTWIDTELPDLGFTRGVVQFAHHSYNPGKARTPDDAHANTWHWDNVEMSPAVPFTIIGATTRQVGGGDDPFTIGFKAAAPQDAYLRFAGLGDDLQFSVDGGDTWQEPEEQWTSDTGGDEHFKPYFTAIPAGTQEVMVRSEVGGGGWRVRDVSIWAPPA